MRVEKELPCGTILMADVVREDDSFNHSFGTFRGFHLELKNFKIIVYIDSMEYDVTAAFEMLGREKDLDYFKSRLLEKAKDEYDSVG